MPLTSDLRHSSSSKSFVATTEPSPQSDKIDLNAKPSTSKASKKETSGQVDSLEVSASKSVKQEQPLLSGSIKDLSELDLNSIEKGILRISMPLNPGRYETPGTYQNADLKIKKNTRAIISLAISRDSQHQTVVQGVNVEFNPPLKVKNPAAAFEPPETGRMARFFNLTGIKDSIADLVLRGMSVAQDGQVVLDGVITKGIFGTEDIYKRFKAERLPKFDMKLDSLLPFLAKPKMLPRPMPVKKTKEPSKDAKPTTVASSVTPPVVPLFNNTFSMTQLLQKAGAMSGEAQYSLQLLADPVALKVGTPDMKVWTEKSPIKVELTGRAKLTRQGSLHLMNDQRSSTVTTGFGKTNVGGQVRVTNLTSTPNVEAQIGLKGNVSQLQGSVKVQDLGNVPFKLGGKGNFVSAQAFVAQGKDGKLQIKDASSAVVNVEAHAATEDPITIQQITAKLGAASLHTQASVNLSVVDNVQIHSGKAEIQARGVDPDVSYNSTHGRIKGEVTTTLKAHQIQFDSSQKAPNVEGQLLYQVVPSEQTRKDLPELKPFARALDVKLKSDGKMALTPQTTGLTEFLSPFTDLVHSPSTVADPKTSPVGQVGSSQWREHIQQVTKAPIRADNRVTLLVDGKQSHPKRMELIKNAKKSICLQTLIFKDDKTGMETANALIEAKKRGVDVYVVIDSLGNMESVKDLIEGNRIYGMLEQAGINFRLFGDGAQKGVREIMQVMMVSEQLQLNSLRQLVDPTKAVPALNFLLRAAQGKVEAGLSDEQRKMLLSGLAKIWGGNGMSDEESVNHLADITLDEVIDLKEAVQIAKQMAGFHHRWHEKYLIVDGDKAIVGGLNVADEYLLGGSGEKVSVMGKSRTAWRDTDMLVEGSGARDAYSNFAKSWLTLTGKKMPDAPASDKLVIGKSEGGGADVQVVQSRPRQEGDHHITNFMIEGLKSLQKGEKAYIVNAYFIPTGVLKNYQQALIDAAKRGVDVRLVTNGKTTTDLPQVNQAAMSVSYRDLLKAGVRIFERTGDRTMHTKACVFGSKVASIGSWNADNRSASLDTECMAVVHNDAFAKEVEDMALSDMKDDVASEVKLSDIEYLPVLTELQNSTVSMISDLM